MRVVFFCHAFPPSVGGTQTLAYNLAWSLVRRGHEILVLTSRTLGSETFRKVDGIEVKRFRRIPFPGPGLPWYPLPSLVLEILSKDLASADVLHGFNSITFSAMMCVTLAKLRNKPSVVHGACHPGAGYPAAIRKYVLSLADAVVAQCAYETKFVRSYVAREKITVVPCGVDPDLFNLMPDKTVFRQKHGFSSEEKIILYVGPLSPHKRVDILLRSMPAMLDKHSGLKLVIVGKGPRVGELPRLAEQLGLSRHVRFLGAISQSMLKEAYSAADVFALLSTDESFGICLLEAAAAGVPIVSTAVGIAPEIIDVGKNGFLLHPTSPGRITELIPEVVRSEGFKAEAQRRRPSILNRFSWDAVAEQVERIYHNVIR